MKLSLLYRELDRGGRDIRVYWLRAMLPTLSVIAFAVGGLILVVRLILTPDAESALSTNNIRSIMTQGVYALLLVQYLFVLVGVPWLLAGTFSSERREGTLDLLILADFSGWDLIAAKVAGALAPAIAIVAAAAPMQMSAIMFGAFDPNILLGHWATLAAGIVFQTGVGLWMSLRSYSPREAFVKSFTIIASLLIVIINLIPVSTVYFRLPSQVYFFVMIPAMLILIGVMFILLTARRLANVAGAADDGLSTGAPPSEAYGGFGEAPPGKLLLSQMAGYPPPSESGQRHVVLAILLIALQFIPIFGWPIALAVVSSGMLMFVRDARRDGVFVDVTLVPESQSLSTVLARTLRVWILVAAPAGIFAVFALTPFLSIIADTPTMRMQSTLITIGVLLGFAVPPIHVHAVRYFALYATTRTDDTTRQHTRVISLASLLWFVGLLPLASTAALYSFLRTGYLGFDETLVASRWAGFLCLLAYGPWNVAISLFAAAWAKRLATDEALLFGSSGGGTGSGKDDEASGIDRAPSSHDYPTMERTACPSLSHSTH